MNLCQKGVVVPKKYNSTLENIASDVVKFAENWIIGTLVGGGKLYNIELQIVVNHKKHSRKLLLKHVMREMMSLVSTAMVEAQRLTNSTGQVYTIFTNAQQLYCVAVNITWVYSEQFMNLISRLGGMHTIMCFIGSVGTLMADSGLEQIMDSTFGGVSKMLSG